MKKYVIVGGGVAAVGCIEGIRSYDKQGSITLISSENTTVYCRPLISYYLQGKTDFEKMKYRPDDFYDKNCKLIFGRAEKIDAINKTVVVNNIAVPYDELCIATGSSPFVPPFSGLSEVTNKFSFMTEDDALKLKNAVNENSRVLIVGAGLIGLKCAEGLCGKVAKITVCDLATRVLSSILDDECALPVQSVLEKNGIEFLLKTSITAFNGNTAQMSDGQNVDFDILVLAVGVRANIGLVKDIGGQINRGIIVDKTMKTSIPAIYAAGDCAEGYDASINADRVLAIWPNAYMQGNCAGANMAGQQTVFDKGIPMNAIGFFGLHVLSAGKYSGTIHEIKTENSLKRLYFEDDVLVGFMLINDIDRAGIYTALIREKTKLINVDIDLLIKNPSLSIYNLENRRKKLGSVV